MEADFTSFRRPADAGWRAPPDFSALVAFLAAAQAAQPTASAAVRIDTAAGEAGDVAAALCGIFAPDGPSLPSGAPLENRFNPAVPFSNAPVTPFKLL